MNAESRKSPFAISNVRRFIAFRLFFNSRFYYPVFTILFLDFGLSLTQFAMLNVVWAVSIVLLEVPSGALADTIGRRKLLIASGSLMVAEMSLLCFVPRSLPILVFAAFLLNRILSGAAEAAASGADEALAYDSLAREGDAADWSRVLDWQLRIQSMGFMLAMTLGAAVYDPALIQYFVRILGFGWTVTRETTLKLPLYLTLGMSIVTLIIALRMKEERETDCTGCGKAVMETFKLTFRAGRWILHTPPALVVILFGMLFDHPVRLLATMSSQYYRMIQLPEALFGVIESMVAALGIFTPRLALWLTRTRSPAFNVLLLGVIAFLGFLGLGLVIPVWGVIPLLMVVGILDMQMFFVSHYLNSVTESHQRATVLSFKGLSNNLAYGAIGLLYSLFMAYLHGVLDPADYPGSGGNLDNAAFIESLDWFPWYFLLFFVITFAFSIWRLRRSGTGRNQPSDKAYK